MSRPKLTLSLSHTDFCNGLLTSICLQSCLSHPIFSLYCHLSNLFYFKRSVNLGASLVTQWWETACQYRRHRSDSWSGKIPHATEELRLCTHSTPEPVHYRACAPEQEKKPQWEAYGVVQSRTWLKWVSSSSTLVYMYKNVLCNVTYNSPKLKTSEMFTDRRMDTSVVDKSHYGT